MGYPDPLLVRAIQRAPCIGGVAGLQFDPSRGSSGLDLLLVFIAEDFPDGHTAQVAVLVLHRPVVEEADVDVFPVSVQTKLVKPVLTDNEIRQKMLFRPKLWSEMPEFSYFDKKISRKWQFPLVSAKTFRLNFV